MRYVFWQNCLSMHQLPFVAKLMDCEGVECVTFVAGTDVDDTRRAMGWSVPQIKGLERCHTIHNPSDEEMTLLLSTHTTNTIHLFSGIRGFSFVYKAFRTSLKYSLTRGLIVERPDTYAFGCANGKPLWLHRIKFMLQDAQYRKYIRYIFAMGDDAVTYYQGLCKQWCVYPFSYCTETPHHEARKENKAASSTLNCLFIGSLTWWKSVSTILDAFALLPPDSACQIRLRIVGDGPERDMLKHKAQKLGLKSIEFIGTVANDHIAEELERSDVLILPSVYDGWGAVVNEALSYGCLAISSDKCGSKELLKDNRCGYVFRSGRPEELATLLTYCKNHLNDIRCKREWRTRWAEQRISGQVLAQYMTDCINGKAPIRPWFLPQE